MDHVDEFLEDDDQAIREVGKEVILPLIDLNDQVTSEWDRVVADCDN